MPSSPAFAPLSVTTSEEDDSSPTSSHPRADVLTGGLAIEYRDGFSSSLCDLFANPQDRSSCCALVCCGIFLNDRNRFAWDGSVGQNWWLRVILSALSVFILFIGIGLKLPLVFAIPLIILCARGILERAKFRQQIKERLSPDQAVHANLSLDAYYLCCMSFVPVDIFYRRTADAGTYQGAPSQHYQGSHNDNDKDSCYRLWSLLRLSCCGCCGCWCNFCGTCAAGQEHRELRRLLPRERFEFDYITFQPYQEYFPALETLRRNQSTSFGEHMAALSQLSLQLIRYLTAGLLILLALSAIHTFKHFRVANVMVVIATLAQAFFVMYLVHWRKHSLDLSLDAVIKLFASGFCLATSVAMVVELIVGQVGELVFAMTVVVDYMQDNPDADFDEDSPNKPDATDFMNDLYQHHFLTLLAFYFFQAFVVASFVEELAKYFCFWMVEHPDYFAQQGDGNAPPRTIHSRAAAITVGMVSTAAGFACCENLIYSLGVGRSFKNGTYLDIFFD
jgi:RsiW-degrading membrane proteinase PrsW (M82 family)